MRKSSVADLGTSLAVVAVVVETVVEWVAVDLRRTADSVGAAEDMVMVEKLH